MPYEQYVTEKILQPLQMSRSVFSREELSELDNVAKGYSTSVTDDGVKRDPQKHLSGKFQSGAGGMNSTVNDLTKYLQMHLNNGSYDRNVIAKPELLQLMRTTHNNSQQSEPLLFPFDTVSYGYGLGIIEDFFGYTLITHGGASGVSGGVVAFIPELKITYTHLYNVGWFSGHLMYIALISLLGKDPYEEIKYLRRREHYISLCGKYQLYRKTGIIEIKNQNGLLYVESNFISKQIVPLIPIDPEETEPMLFYQYNDTGRLRIHFHKPSSSEIYVESERNLYKKLSYSADLEPFSS